MWLELLALVPGGLVIVWALIQGMCGALSPRLVEGIGLLKSLKHETNIEIHVDHKLAPLYLLVWATYYVTSTVVCFVEMVGAKDWPAEDLAKNRPGYIVFGLIGRFKSEWRVYWNELS